MYILYKINKINKSYFDLFFLMITFNTRTNPGALTSYRETYLWEISCKHPTFS